MEELVNLQKALASVTDSLNDDEEAADSTEAAESTETE
jgi:hypothetical protein